MGTAIRQFLSRLLAVVRWRRSDAGLDEEICGHLDLLTADHIRARILPVIRAARSDPAVALRQE